MKEPFTILHVDDDPDDREFFRQAILEIFSGITIISIKNGNNLPDYLSDKIDLIFLDINMPGKTGIECLIDMRNNPKLTELPIIILSTSSNRKDIIESYEHGANIFLTKPLFFNDYALIVKGAINFLSKIKKPFIL